MVAAAGTSRVPRLPTFLVVLLLVIYVTTTSAADQSKPKRCLVNVEEVQPPRFFHVKGVEHVLTIGTSKRPAHHLLSLAFKIFLQEVLGYAKVEVIEEDDFYNASIALKQLHYPRDSDSNHVPKAMINLELPMSASMDLNKHIVNTNGTAAFDDCGIIGPSGRFGWFIPNHLVASARAQQQQPAPDHWRIFTRPEWAAIFDQNITQLVPYTRDPISKQFYCKTSYCTNGIHVPEQCQASRGKVKSCAILLASYPADTEFVVAQIAQLKLFVRVVWVGPFLKNLTDTLADEAFVSMSNSTTLHGVVALSWHPSTLTASRRYTSISFPACDPSDASILWPCERLALHRLVKIAWTRLDQKWVQGISPNIGGKAAYEAVHSMQITVKDYDDLLMRYSKAGNNVNFEELACEWLKDRQDVNMPTRWKHWVPNEDSDRTSIDIGGIFPMGGSTAYTAKGILTAATMAIAAVNNNTSILRDYKLNLRAFNGRCKADFVMKSYIDYIRSTDDYYRLAGIVGPACSDTVEPLAGVSKHFNTIIISYSAEGSSFNDRTKYPYFFRTIGENKQYKNVYLQLLRKLNWLRVAALTEDGQKYTEYISHMQDLLQANGISFIANRKFPRDKEAQDMKQYLMDLNDKKAKIIIADVHDNVARAVMCEAYHLKMTGYYGYIWFLPLWLSQDWYNSDRFNIQNNETINCTTAQMTEAINGHLSIAHAYFAPDEDKMQESITVGEWKKKYELACSGSGKFQVPQSNYAGYAYDAVWTYAYALDKLIKANQSHIANLHSSDSTRNFVKFIESTDFNGVSGHISFREGPSRVSLINVVQWYNNESYIVGTYYPNNTGNGTGQLNLNVSAIRWVTADGKQPDDGTEPPPTCFVSPIADFFNTSCEIAIVIINLLGFGILGTILLFTFILMKRRYEKMTEKYMRSMGIDLLPNAASLASLDKWEIAREHVVINRKLGEGAFGTVYGGEANFPDKGWVAVAVKTLKVGSTTEVKLDFLSEAEVMKRLDHQNIVRLLGVCTKNEPVYTIMEFMLYGDLKTFLLARRHLVTERSTEESDEISSKKLTNMALDVARALTYLADLKYVHRDVACRNCMVNANRVVKLGDFGMTRAMYESDYYKFNRKGMLPVRWMAPESLGLGIFTPQSDIWSYGVLLYEIITFGSFPFQGMSNSQVLEFVKNGSTLTIPKGVKSQLENLLKSCWLPDHKKRPNASEIVEFLANNPRLIAPCLDVPLASVQMEDTGQLELQLPEKSRKCSVSLKTRHRSLSGGSHAATTPNSPTSIEPSTKLARSATTQDVMQAIPLLPAPPNNARHASTSSSTSPDTVPLLSTSMLATEVDLIRPAIQSVTVPILPPPPSRNVDFIQENGGPLSPHRRLSGTLPLTKYVGYPNQRPKQQENGGVDYQATSVL